MISKTHILYTIAVVAMLGMALEPSHHLVNNKTTAAMKMNAGISTNKLKETKTFYQEVLQFGITFENDFYLLLHTPGEQSSISFLQADHPAQQPIFQPLYPGKGMYLTVEVPDADAAYRRIKALGVKIEVEIRDELWGDRHFSFYDPNGIGIDIVTYKAPAD